MSETDPIKIEFIENTDVSDTFYKNELIEYFNELITKHARTLKKQGSIIVYDRDFIIFPDNDIIETVVDLFCLSGFAIYFYKKNTNEIILEITTNTDDLFDEVYKMDFQAMTGTYAKVRNIHKTCDDRHRGRKWIESIGVTEFGHEGMPYRAINLSKTGFDIIKLDVPDAPHRSSSKRKSIFNFFD